MEAGMNSLRRGEELRLRPCQDATNPTWTDRTATLCPPTLEGDGQQMADPAGEQASAGTVGPTPEELTLELARAEAERDAAVAALDKAGATGSVAGAGLAGSWWACWSSSSSSCYPSPMWWHGPTTWS